MNRLIILGLLIFLSPAFADEPNDLQSLLEQVKNDRSQEKQALAKRESVFANDRNKQKELLAEASKKLEEVETRSESLRRSYDSNDIEIARQNALLREKMGALGELDGIVKQIAGDLDVIIDTSLVSAQKPDRDKILNVLSSRKELPSLQELEELWILAMDEMVESGKVVTFPGKIVTAAGNEIEQDVTRIGVFNAVSAGRFLRNLADNRDSVIWIWRKILKCLMQGYMHFLSIQHAVQCWHY